jgi:glucosamine--fructose-6-phosphate aminotransferase (isomerizing)
MLEQPEVFNRLLRTGLGHDVVAMARRDPPSRIVLTGCGDSFCAAECGAWALRLAARDVGGWSGAATAVRPLELGRYRSDILDARTWVIAISASGRTRRVMEAAGAAQAAGARVLAVTDDPGSPLAMEAGHVLRLHASPTEELLSSDYSDPSAEGYVGYHHDVPQTKTFTASVFVILQLSGMLMGDGGSAWRRRLEDLPGASARILQNVKADASSAAEVLVDAPLAVFVGSGPLLPHARYGAFKMYEFARVGLWQEMEEYCHTQYFITGQDTPVIFLSIDELSRERAGEVAPVLTQTLGARCILISSTGSAPGFAHAIPLDLEGPEHFHPLLLNLALQRMVHAFALRASLSTSTFRGGLDPERYVAGSMKTIRASRIVGSSELGIDAYRQDMRPETPPDR